MDKPQKPPKPTSKLPREPVKLRLAAPSHHKQPPQRRVVRPFELPRPPADLAPAAAAEWERIAPMLASLGVDMVMDLQLLRAYCATVGDLADVREVWVREGSPAVVQRPSGPRPHPLVALMRTYQRDTARFAAELGLSAKSRKSLGLTIVPTAVAESARDAPPGRPKGDYYG